VPLGTLFRVSVFGESHGSGVGALVEGCPPGLEITEEEINRELERRRPGGPLRSPRREEDRVRILSGVFNNHTTGAPIALFIENVDVDSTFYEKIRNTPRPGHADLVARIKYRGFNDYRGGGILSGRITAGMVAAGCIAKKLLEKHGIRVYSYIKRIGNIEADVSPELIEGLKSILEESPVYCPDAKASKEMIRLVRSVAGRGDSIGGTVETVVLNLPVGLGEPPLDTLDGDIAKAVFIIPGVKGIEFGAGFKLAEMRGSEANDEWVVREGRIVAATNNAGGIVGGMSTGSPLVFRVVFKPTPTIRKPLRTVELTTLKPTVVRGSGRHDPCIAIRGVPVVEAVTSIVIADHLLRWLSWKNLD